VDESIASEIRDLPSPPGIPSEPCQSRFKREPVWPVLNEPEGWLAMAGTRMPRLLQSTRINSVVNDDEECSES
jgi:hypothetical protein